MINVTRDPIVPDLVIDTVRGDSGHGAVVSFIGSLRGRSADGRQVRFAECESDEQGMEQHLRRIGEEILANWQLENAAICIARRPLRPVSMLWIALKRAS